MIRITLLLCTAACLLSSCNLINSGPYKGYRMTDDEAVPASRIDGAPYRTRR